MKVSRAAASTIIASVTAAMMCVAMWIIFDDSRPPGDSSAWMPSWLSMILIVVSAAGATWMWSRKDDRFSWLMQIAVPFALVVLGFATNVTVYITGLALQFGDHARIFDVAWWWLTTVPWLSLMLLIGGILWAPAWALAFSMLRPDQKKLSWSRRHA